MKYSSHLFLICAFFNVNNLTAGLRISDPLRKNLFEGTMISMGAAGFLAISAGVVELLPSTRNDLAIKDFRSAALSAGAITIFCTLLSSAFDKKIVAALVAAALSGYCLSTQFAHKDNRAYGQEPTVASKRWWFLGGAGASMAATSVGWLFLWCLNKYYIGSSRPLFPQSWQSMGIETGVGIAAIGTAFRLLS
jgi:hypothetical protein